LCEYGLVCKISIFVTQQLDVMLTAVGEGEFYGQCSRSSRDVGVLKRDAGIRRVSEEIVSTTVSVELYGPPHSCHGDVTAGMNSHPKLTHLSSLSAPDVNEVCSSYIIL